MYFPVCPNCLRDQCSKLHYGTSALPLTPIHHRVGSVPNKGEGLEAVCKRSLQLFREGPVVPKAEELQQHILVANTGGKVAAEDKVHCAIYRVWHWTIATLQLYRTYLYKSYIYTAIYITTIIMVLLENVSVHRWPPHFHVCASHTPCKDDGQDTMY